MPRQLNKVVAFVVHDEHEAAILRLTELTGWSRSTLFRELLLRAEVQRQPSVAVAVPAGYPDEAA